MSRHFCVKPIKASTAITAADEDEGFMYEEEDDGLGDALDDIQNQVEDVQDQVDDIDEDEVDIEMNNNIEDHYIAECDKCHGVFISAVVESEQDIESITGTCPLCQKESEQFLKWIIRKNEK